MSISTTNYITDEVEALIGARGSVVTAPEPVDLSSIRRFAQAIMDPDPLYFDEDYAASTRYGRVMAPPLYPLHAARRPGGVSDPLTAADHDPEYDGAGDLFDRIGLPRVPIPLHRLLNGGNTVEIHALAGVGDVISSQAKIASIEQKDGRSGALIIVDVETDYLVAQNGTTLLRSRQVYIWR